MLATKVNLWRSTQSVISWFNNIQDKQNALFVSFDIVENSISENLLNEAMDFAVQHVNISKHERHIIMQAKRTLLFSENEPWTKKDVSVNSFHPALKYIWVVSECSFTFLDINVSISGNRLSTSVHYKPTDSHSYLLHSSSHPAHVKNSIPYSQFLRLRRLCSDDTDFSEKAEEMCQFFKARGYPDPVIHNSKQSVHPQSAPLSSHNKLEGRITLTLTFHPHNISVKNIILKNFKLLQHDPTTAEIFAQPLLISYKRDKNLSNFLDKSTLKSDHQPGTFKCALVRCPFISNAIKISGPKRTVAITDHFSCISTNLIYCITCTLRKKVYIGETGRRLGDRFREHLRDVEINDKDASKPVARHFNLPNHS